jgi:hypothetical protein
VLTANLNRHELAGRAVVLTMWSDRLPSSTFSYELDGRERRGQLLGGCLDRVGHGD